MSSGQKLVVLVERLKQLTLSNFVIPKVIAKITLCGAFVMELARG